VSTVFVVRKHPRNGRGLGPDGAALEDACRATLTPMSPRSTTSRRRQPYHKSSEPSCNTNQQSSPCGDRANSWTRGFTSSTQHSRRAGPWRVPPQADPQHPPSEHTSGSNALALCSVAAEPPLTSSETDTAQRHSNLSPSKQPLATELPAAPPAKKRTTPPTRLSIRPYPPQPSLLQLANPLPAAQHLAQQILTPQPPGLHGPKPPAPPPVLPHQRAPTRDSTPPVIP
jgi:hypothetical protein